MYYHKRVRNPKTSSNPPQSRMTMITIDSWRKHVCTIIRLIAFLCCMACFIANSWMSVIQYAKKTTTTASYTTWHDDGIIPPSLTFCNFGKENALNEELSLEEALGNLTIISGGPLAKYELRPMRTINRGTCYLIDLEQKVLMLQHQHVS